MQHTIKTLEDAATGFRFYELKPPKGRTVRYPSVTTVLDAVLPADDHLKNFFREYGYIGQRVFKKAGEYGENVHYVIDTLESVGRIKSAGLNDKEKKCIEGFINWNLKFKPTPVESESIVISKKHKYAGRLDRIYDIGGVPYVVDFKTGSKKSYHKCQVAAYWNAIKTGDINTPKTAILYLGTTSKQGYTWTEFEPEEYFKQFLHYRKSFDILYPKASEIFDKKYPEEFTL